MLAPPILERLFHTEKNTTALLFLMQEWDITETEIFFDLQKYNKTKLYCHRLCEPWICFYYTVIFLFLSLNSFVPICDNFRKNALKECEIIIIV